MTPTQIYSQLRDAGADLKSAVAYTDDLLARQRPKLAWNPIEKAFDAAAKLTAPAALGLAAVPPAAGYLLGDLLAQGLDSTSDSVTEIQEQELVKELRDNAALIRKRRALRGHPEDEER